MTGTLRNAIASLGLLVAMFLGFGAIEELVVRGIRGGEAQPLVVGTAGVLVSIVLGMAALGVWRRHWSAPRLATVAAIAAIVFHGYAALPPHRNVGLLVLIVAAAYSVALLGFAIGHRSARGQTPGVRRS